MIYAILPPDGTTWIGYKFDCIAHCYIALDCPIGIISYYWLGISISQSHIS